MFLEKGYHVKVLFLDCNDYTARREHFIFNENEKLNLKMFLRFLKLFNPEQLGCCDVDDYNDEISLLDPELHSFLKTFEEQWRWWNIVKTSPNDDFFNICRKIEVFYVPETLHFQDIVEPML